MQKFSTDKRLIDNTNRVYSTVTIIYKFKIPIDDPLSWNWFTEMQDAFSIFANPA